MDVYERLDDMSADTAQARAAHILHGLGFTREMQNKMTKDFSGWFNYFSVSQFSSDHDFTWLMPILPIFPQVVGVCELDWQERCMLNLIYYCWMNPLTIWIQMLVSGWKKNLKRKLSQQERYC